MKYIPVTQPLFAGNEIKYVTDCIQSTWISSGKFVERFEKKFAAFCNTSYASTTSSGTTALHLTLLALKIKAGDEVIIPDFTYVSTANAVKYVGAKPILVDVDMKTWTIDPKKIEEKITKNTKAIIAVHLFGHPADMDAINIIVKKYKLAVIEDACQALGALFKGKKVGSLSEIGCFSFSGAKTITTGEGGMITTNDEILISKIESMKSNFTDGKRHFFHPEIGYPYRLTNIQAALGLAQFEKINNLTALKIKIAKTYSKILKDEKDIQFPYQQSWAKNVYWLYSIILKRSGLRNKLANYLKKNGIQTRPFFVPMHKLPMYREKRNYENSDYLAENGLSLPSGVTLSDNEIEYICSKVKKFLRSHG